MSDAEREARAIWKLEQGGYRMERQGGRYILTSNQQSDELDDLAQLAAFAEAVYERVWTGRRITPSA
jgi:hypothetical protein